MIMRRSLIWLAIAVSATVGLPVAAVMTSKDVDVVVTHSTLPPAPFGLNWDTTLSDEFNGTSLDTSKWRVASAGIIHDGFSGNPVDDGVSVSGGNLNLTVSFDGSNYHYGSVQTTAAVTSQPEPSYYEWRAKEAVSSTHVTSILWMLANDIEGINEKVEFDVQETIAPGMNSHAHITDDTFTQSLGSTGASITSCGGHSINNTDGNFHIYGLYRHDGQADYFFDGCLTLTIPFWDPAQRTQRQQIIMQAGCEPQGCNSSIINGLPTTMQVDYFRLATSTGVITPPPPPPVPAGAAAAGFNTVAADYDFTSPMPANWLDSYPSDNGTHLWYPGYWYRSDIPPVSQSIRQVTDPVYGGTVLDLTWLASYGSMDQGYTEMQTESHDSTRRTDFPQNRYEEIVYRVQTTPNVSTTTGWQNVGGSFFGQYSWTSQSRQVGSLLDLQRLLSLACSRYCATSLALGENIQMLCRRNYAVLPSKVMAPLSRTEPSCGE